MLTIENTFLALVRMTINSKDVAMETGVIGQRQKRSAVDVTTSDVVDRDYSATSHRNPVARGRLMTAVLPGLLGSALYFLNNLDVVHGLIAPPPGYVPLGIQRNADVAQYLTWIRGLETAWILPNYHAPWFTPPGLIVPALLPVSILERWFSENPILALQLFSFAGYLFAAYALAFAYATFCQTRSRAFWSLLLALSCVPLVSLPGVSHFLRNHSQYSGALDHIQFMMVSDGFLRGLVTWPFQTYGTGGQVLSMALLARYCNSREPRWLGYLALVCLLSALFHPFEVFVTVTVVGIVLLQQNEPIINSLTNFSVVSVAATVGLSPYLIQSLRVPWVREVAEANRHLVEIMPAPLFAMIGLPGILVIALCLLGFPQTRDHNTTVMKAWFFCTLLVFFVPRMPFAIHMLDGLFIVVGLLLAAQMQDLSSRRPFLPKPVLCTVGVLLVAWSLIPHVAFRWRAWRDGIDVSNTAFKYPSTVSPLGEFATIQWLRTHASSEDLVLASEDAAPWMTTAPVHSFASHWVLSLLVTHPRYGVLRDSFFDGNLTALQAHDLLEDLGVRFVVVPDASPAIHYLDKASMRAHFNTTAIYEIPAGRMKLYGDSKILEMGRP